MKKYSDTGHIVTVFYYVPHPDREEAIDIVEALVAEVNELSAIRVNEDDHEYLGFAEVRGTEEIVLDFDINGFIIGSYKEDEFVKGAISGEQT